MLGTHRRFVVVWVVLCVHLLCTTSVEAQSPFNLTQDCFSQLEERSEEITKRLYVWDWNPCCTREYYFIVASKLRVAGEAIEKWEVPEKWQQICKNISSYMIMMSVWGRVPCVGEPWSEFCAWNFSLHIFRIELISHSIHASGIRKHFFFLFLVETLVAHDARRFQKKDIEYERVHFLGTIEHEVKPPCTHHTLITRGVVPSIEIRQETT